MRTLLLATAFLLLCANPTRAQKVGERVVVKIEQADLKKLHDVIWTVPKGTVLTVREVNGDSLWVMTVTGNQTKRGWIKRSDVVDLGAAIELLNNELKRRPSAELYAVRGIIWEEKAEHANAIDDYTEALRLDPENAVIYHCRGYAWACKGDDDKAIGDYTESIRQDPTDEAAFFNRGNAWFRKSEFDTAIADYSESIRLDPSDGLAYLNRGQAWAKKGDHEKANADYARSDINDPHLSLPLTAIVVEGNKTIATDEILMLIKSRPGNAIDPKQIKEDIRALCAKRWFFDVETRIRQSKTGPGTVLVFRVAEKPILEKITYMGNRKISDKVLNEVHMLKVKGGYDVGANREAAHRIKAYYQEEGYTHVDVELEEGDWPDDRKVIFRIDEGSRYKIAKTAFEGNQALSDDALRAGLKVQLDEAYDHRAVRADREKILTQYAMQGRILAKVQPRVRDLDEPDKIEIVYEIDEGRSYDIAQTERPLTDGPSTKDDASGTLRKTGVEKSVAEHPELRDIDRLIFEGIKTHDIDDIRDSLHRDFDLALAAHPAHQLTGFIETLHAQLQAGFRHSGFPDVAVKVDVDDKAGRIAVAVTEGRRCRCGDVEIDGAKNLPVEKLVQSLTEGPKPIRILWKIGGPAPCDDDSLTLIRERLQEEAAEAGFLSSKFDVRINREPNQDTAQLVVTVIEEGLPSVVGQIEVTGAKRDTTEDLLKYLDLRTGTPFDSRLPYRLEQRLAKSGRYLTMDVTAKAGQFPAPDRQHEIRDVQIKLREYADAPKLADELSPAEEAFVKLGEWLDRWSKGEIEEDLVMTASSNWCVVPILGVTPVTARMVVAPNRGQTIVVNASGADRKAALELVFAAYPDRLVLAAPLRKAKLVLPNSAEDRLTLNAAGRSASGQAIDRGDQAFRLNLGLGWSSRKRRSPSAFEVKTEFSPAFLMSLLHYGNPKAELAAGTWKIHVDSIVSSTVLQIDAASGRLVSLQYRDEIDESSLTIRAEKDALKSELQTLEGPLAVAAAVYDAASPWKSRLEFFVDAWLDVANARGIAEDVESLRALRKLVGLWSPPAIADLFDWDKPSRNPDDPFWIPSHLSSFTYDGCLRGPTPSRKNLVGSFVLPVYDRLVPRSSWLSKAGHDALLTWASADSTTLASLHENIESTEAGPVGEWFLGMIDPYLDLDLRERTGFAGIKRLAVEAFRRDYRPLLADDSWLGRWLMSLGQALRSLDESEIRALGRLLPAEASYDAAIECLKSLKNDPSETIEQALSSTLDSYWNDELRTALSASLRRIVAAAIPKRLPERRENQVRPASAEVDAQIKAIEDGSQK